MSSTFDRHPPRSMIEVWMCMWGEIMPKRGQLEYPDRISPKALQLLPIEYNHMFVMVSCPYVGMDW